MIPAETGQRIVDYGYLAEAGRAAGGRVGAGRRAGRALVAGRPGDPRRRRSPRGAAGSLVALVIARAINVL